MTRHWNKLPKVPKMNVNCVVKYKQKSAEHRSSNFCFVTIGYFESIRRVGAEQPTVLFVDLTNTKPAGFWTPIEELDSWCYCDKV